ncbi:MAG: hypothetical protein EP318_02030 [Rhodobacteraceae bacterium]|nr:MAG: hypothetical protein EP318_02030 [Paracoccaceae bacterium]
MDVNFAKLSERLTDGLIGNDFDLYRSVFCLPVRVEPRDGAPYTLETEQALRQDMALYVSAMQIHRITAISRDVISVLELDSDWVEVTAVNTFFSHGALAVEPFRAQFILRSTEAGWRIGGIRSSLGHINWTLGRATIEHQAFRSQEPGKNSH